MWMLANNILGKSYSKAGEWQDAAYNGSASLKLISLTKDNIGYSYSPVVP